MTEKKPVTLIIDNKEIQTEEGKTLLEVSLDNGIYIPNLCYIRGMDRPPGSCRLCFVEIKGENGPVASCTIKVMDGMVVKTDTQEVRRLQRSALRLLLSVHHIECARCPANKKCELQKLAKFLDIGLKAKGLNTHLKETEVEESHPLLNYYPNRCVLCGKCIFVCTKRHHEPLLTFAKRGLETVISYWGAEGATNLPCKECQACIDICPVSAITFKAST
jgi:bidirectional [NiFe] hydrogenase diaphorase subunit